MKRKLFLFLFQASFKYIDRELMKRLLCYFFFNLHLFKSMTVITHAGTNPTPSSSAIILQVLNNN